jgi:integrase
MGKILDTGAPMPRMLNRLTAMKVAKAKRPGLLSDGGGLYLRIAPGGSKQFIFRYAVNGRLRDMGIGPTHTVDLAMAREKALEARRLRLEGIDPIAHRRARVAALQAADAKAMTFRQCAEGFIRDNEKEWRSARHRQQWTSTLAKYVYPELGELPVAAIDTPLVLRVVKPLWADKTVTAARVRGRIEAILGWATVHHYRSGDNPARWQGLLEHALPAQAKIAKTEHHAALPYTEVAPFMAKLQQDTSAAAKCLQFIVLTAARLVEATGATWAEIDFEARTWTVPATRMKGGREHRVPLSDAAMAVLEAMRAVRMSNFVFPGLLDGRPVGMRTVQDLVKIGGEITVHGLRSSFRDWAAERTSFPREVCEMALAHAIPDAVEAAYRRGDLFEKRRKLMNAWAAYCAKVEMDAGKVVALARARTPR